MTNLATTQPDAFNAFVALLQDAAALQNPAVSVFDSEVVQYEPGRYVMLTGFEDHRFEVAALGSYAFYEEYGICGIATYLQGDIDAATVRADTFALFNDVVMDTVVANRGQPYGNPVLGSQAPQELEWIIPTYARYEPTPGDFGGGQAGFQGVIEFCFTVHARITAA